MLQDVAVSARQLMRRPAFTLVAILTLAIGMGVTAVAFTVVNRLFVQGFGRAAVPGVGRIVSTPAGDEGGNVSLQEFEQFAAAATGAADVAAEGRLSLAWRHGGTTRTAWVLFVSPGYFSLVTPDLVAGRLLVQGRTGGAPSVVIGERFWRDQLAGQSLAGLTLRLNQVDVSVAGVMADTFTGPAGLYSPDVWVPLDELSVFGTSPALQRDTRWLFVLARPRPDATAAHLNGLVDLAATRMAQEWPETHKDRGARFQALGANSEIRGTAVALFMGIVGLVFLLACFNVANLLLARAVERERDLGLRTALGARPARLIRLVLTEGVLVAVLAGALVAVVVSWTQVLLGSFAMPIEQPQHLDLRPDGTVIAFVAGLVLLAGVLPGAWPALSAARLDVTRVLGSLGGHSSGGRPSPLRRWLVGAQVAGSTIFLALSLLFLQSHAYLSRADMGFARAELLLAQFEPASSGYDRARAEQYAEALTSRLGALPGVSGVALADRAPFFIGVNRVTAASPSAGTCGPGACPAYPTFAVSPGYFATMGIALAEGREFAHRGGRVVTEVVVNEAFARAVWPAGGALGATLVLGAEGNPATIVGIAARSHTRGLDRESPTLFVPLSVGHYDGPLTLVVRAASPAALLRPLEEAAQSVDPNVPVSVTSMDQRMAVQLWPFRTLALMFSICGTLALILATVGLAGMVVHAVSRRLREFGVRMSLGATPRDLVAHVIGSGFALLGPGLLVGLLVAAALARVAQAAFIGVNVLNPRTYVLVALTQAIVVTLACGIPAFRAGRVDPLRALRAD